MGQIKHRLLFFGLSVSAYVSPLLMIISILTINWLESVERFDPIQGLRDKVTTSINSTGKNLPKNIYHLPLGTITANFGLWRMCRITDGSNQQQCENIKYFQHSDSDTRVTDTLKKQVGVSIIPVAISMVLMLSSVILHTYAYIRQKLHYLFFLSGCLFIFAGLASLTALIVFIAAVNGAVDNKQTAVKSKDDESPFAYNYGYSFFFAVGSFLMQEFNGICNIYWYVDYHRKYRFKNENQISTKKSKFPPIPQVIKLTKLENLEKSVEKQPEIKIISGLDKKSPITERSNQQNQIEYNLCARKVPNDRNFLSAPVKEMDESSLSETSHHCSSSSTCHLTESSSSVSSEYLTKVNTLSNRQLDENELKFKFYKLDKEMLPPAPILNPFRTKISVSPPCNKIRVQSAKYEYKIKPSGERTKLTNRSYQNRLNKPLLQKNKSLNDAYFYLPLIYEQDFRRDYAYNVMTNEHTCDKFARPSRVNFVNHSANRRLVVQSPYTTQVYGSQFNSPLIPKERVCSEKRCDFKRTTSV